MTVDAVDAILPTLSGSGAKVFLALTLYRNGGPPDAPIQISLRRLSECTGLMPGSTASGRNELLFRGLVSQDGAETYRLLRPLVPWLPPNGTAIPKSRTPGKASTPEVLALTSSGLRALGMKETGISSRYAVLVRRCVMKLLNEDQTPADMMRVVDWAVRRRDRGDSFPGLSNLAYLWGRLFPAHLAAANAEQCAPGTLVFRRGNARSQFDADAKAAAKRPLPAIYVE